jgi:hypothetical protein
MRLAHRCLRLGAAQWLQVRCNLDSLPAGDIKEDQGRFLGAGGIGRNQVRGDEQEVTS